MAESQDLASLDSNLENILRDLPPPFEFDRVAIDKDGRARKLEQPRVVHFNFVDLGIRYHVAAASLPGHTRILVFCPLGTIPYSIESRSGRQTVLALIAGMRKLPIGQLTVGSHLNLRIEALLDLDAPMSAAVLLAGAASFVARIRHFVQLFAEYSPGMPAPVITEDWLQPAG
jgi:hypothetical protein